MIKAWKAVFDKHQGKEDTWTEFIQKYGQYEQGLHDAPQDCPPAELLHSRAQKANNESSAGSEGFAPRETKALQLAAWTYRGQVMQLMAKLGRQPQAYYTVSTPAIPKKGKGHAPLDPRLLAAFSSLDRIEAAAWFEHLSPW